MHSTETTKKLAHTKRMWKKLKMESNKPYQNQWTIKIQMKTS